MRKISLIVLYFFVSVFSFGQESQDNMGVQDSDFPSFSYYRLADSVLVSSQDLPREGIVLIKLYRPGCHHCREEATRLYDIKDSINQIKTVWLSGPRVRLSRQKAFFDNYKIADLNPIAVGKLKDAQLFIDYEISGVPYTFLVIDGKLVKEYRGSNLDFRELIEFNQAYTKYLDD